MTDASMSRSLPEGYRHFAKRLFKRPRYRLGWESTLCRITPTLEPAFPPRCGNVTQEIDMIGLRRAVPDRQDSPVPRTTKVQERLPLRSKIQKLLRPALLAADQLESMFIEFFARRHGRAF